MARENDRKRAAANDKALRLRADRHAPKSYQNVYKGNSTISARPVLTKATRNVPKKTSRTIKKSKEPDILENFCDSIDYARNTILEKYPTALEQTRDELVAKVNDAQDRSQAFNTKMKDIMSRLSTSFAKEQFETEYEKHGKKHIENTQLDKTLDAHKTAREATRQELKKEWATWSKIQEKIVDLGVSVIGRESFEGYTGEMKGKTTHMEEMKLLEEEHNAKMKEFSEEISALGTELVDKLIAADTAITVRFEQQQAEIRRYIRDMD